MYKTLAAAVATIGTALWVAAAAPAAAAPDDIASWGNDTLGGTIGTTGGSVAIAGYRTTIDGFNTLQGHVSIVGPGVNLRNDQSYSASEFENTTTIGDSSFETEFYPNPLWAKWTANAPGGSVSLVCYPTTGCHQE